MTIILSSKYFMDLFFSLYSHCSIFIIFSPDVANSLLCGLLTLHCSSFKLPPSDFHVVFILLCSSFPLITRLGLESTKIWERERYVTCNTTL